MKKNQFDNLLRILKLTGGKYILVENGRPRAVLMDYDEFQELVLPSVTEKLVKQMGEIESVNKEITRAQLEDLHQEVIQPDADFWQGPEDEEITVEPID